MKNNVRRPLFALVEGRKGKSKGRQRGSLQKRRAKKENREKTIKTKETCKKAREYRRKQTSQNIFSGLERFLLRETTQLQPLKNNIQNQQNC
ncbi:MAG: hypothetical protein ACOX19_01295 [Fermentimonas sp.]